MIIAGRHHRSCRALLFFSLVLLLAGFHNVSAETAGQPVINSTTTDTTDSPVSTVTDTVQAPLPLTQTEAAKRLGPQVDPCYTLKVAGDNWMDQVHGFVQDNTCEPAVWFDTFFVKDHVLLDLRPGLFIRLRNSARWTESQTVDYIRDLHLEWELPQWKKFLKKAKLYFESRSAADKYTTQPGQPIEPAIDRQTGTRKPIIGLRLDPYARLRALVSIDSGVKIGIHSDAHIRMRYQYVNPFGEVYLLRFSEIAMWQAVEHFSNTMQFDLERKFTPFTFLRWGNNVTYIEDTPGVTWNTGVSLFTQLTPKNAISYDTSIWGVNHPHWATHNYRVGLHYRRNFYRPWLFFELAPEVTWPKDASGHRNSVYAFMATLEIQFGK